MMDKQKLVSLARAALPSAVAALSFPASGLESLRTNDDSLCIQFGFVLFGAVAVAQALAANGFSERLTAWVGLSAIVLQALALHWVESAPFFQIIRDPKSDLLRAWFGLFALTCGFIVVHAGYVLFLHRGNPRRPEAAAQPRTSPDPRP